MSVARTARRRRKQAKMGYKGLEQVYGKRAAPHYPSPLTSEASAKREARYRNKQKIMAGRRAAGKK